eukprot:TRINITY_DN49720_c0_g1_i1.p1 TRINITY_DN49720_c0_g1~~TRINITY_DN49720_c0_g1_i1.p1  ORF type:complete len:629 (-),score=63.28 TRINITY_DN49720_c0_g1_i1:168-2054(-)
MLVGNAVRFHDRKISDQCSDAQRTLVDAVNYVSSDALKAFVLPVGVARLDALMDTFFDVIGKADMTLLRTYIRSVWRDNMSIGSFCSGTESPVLVFEAFARVAQRRLDIQLGSTTHAFSAELNPKKQNFIKKLFPNGGPLFRDVNEMVNDKAWCVKSKCDLTVPGAMCAFGGFPCQDVSSMNPKAKTTQNKSCIQEGSMRTGSVAGSIMKYTSKHSKSLKFLILENVPNLASRKDNAESNLDVLSRMMRQQTGFLLHCWKLDPRLFGSPVGRSRLWMTRLPQQTVSSLSEAATHKMLSDIMTMLANKVKLNDFQQYLLSPDDQWLSTGVPKRTPTDKSKPSTPTPSETVPKWMLVHQRAFADLGKDRNKCPGVVPSKKVMARFPLLGSLTRRQLEIIYLLGVTLPEKSDRIIDTSQSHGYASVTDHIPCITPGGTKLLTSQCRYITGLESLRFQGIWHSDDASVRSFNDTLLRDLAGNSFETSCASAALFSTMIFSARMYAQRPPSPTCDSILDTGANPGEENDSDDDITFFWGLGSAVTNSATSQQQDVAITEDVDDGNLSQTDVATLEYGHDAGDHLTQDADIAEGGSTIEATQGDHDAVGDDDNPPTNASKRRRIYVKSNPSNLV